MSTSTITVTIETVTDDERRIITQSYSIDVPDHSAPNVFRFVCDAAKLQAEMARQLG